MPDVIVVGGGIIGAACARELASAGTSVTLLEKDELAAGASGRNLGYLDTSKDPVLAPLARASLASYREAVEEAPFPVFLDDEPIGTLALTLDEDELEDLRRLGRHREGDRDRGAVRRRRRAPRARARGLAGRARGVAAPRGPSRRPERAHRLPGLGGPVARRRDPAPRARLAA